MKVFEAKKRVSRHRLVSILIMAVSAIFFVLAVLKTIYFAMSGDASVFAAFARAIQRLVQLIYENTQFLSFFWKWAPVANPQALNSSGNYGLLFIVLCGAIGRIMWDSANILSARIANTVRRVEELGWERELMGQHELAAGAKPDVLQINIELEQNEQWYKRPIGLIIIGITIAVLGQLANLQFGLFK